MKKILLVTNYSEAALNAEHYAVRFAQDTKSAIILFHTYELPLPSSEHTLSYDETIRDLEISETEKLRQHRDELFHSLKIKPNELNSECMVRGGITEKQIHETAKELNTDFIVVETHDASSFRNAIFGSHTWDVIKKASVPVLSIPKDALFTGIKNIVFGTQYRESEILVLNFLVQFAKQFDAELTVLHVTSYVLSKKFEAEMFEKFSRDIKGKLSYNKLHIQLIKSDDVLQGVSNFCKRKKVDLLVTSPEKPSFFGNIFDPVLSMTRKMSFHTTIPLMTIPDCYNPRHIAFSEKYLEQTY